YATVDRDAHRVRYHPLRGMHSARRWQTDQILYALRRAGRWARCADGRRSGAQWAITPYPGRVLAGARSAMWLLHTGDAHDRLCLLAAQPRPDRRGDPLGHLRQSVPLHGVCQHCQSGPVCSGEDTAGGGVMTPRTSPEVGGMGHAVKRKEDPRFLRGKGTYVDDIELPGMLYLDIVRSPYAHATITNIDA